MKDRPSTVPAARIPRVPKSLREIKHRIKHVKNEGRSGDMYENKGRMTQLPIVKGVFARPKAAF